MKLHSGNAFDPLKGLRVTQMSKQIGLAVVVAAVLGTGTPSISHADTYVLDIGSSGNVLGSPVGTVNITGTIPDELTYQFNLTSGVLSAVYMDVSGTLFGVWTDGGAWSGYQGSSTTA